MGRIPVTPQRIAGLTERQICRLEEGNTVPHADTLKNLAAAHGLSIDDYLKELAKRSGARRKVRKEPRGTRSKTRRGIGH